MQSVSQNTLPKGWVFDKHKNQYFNYASLQSSTTRPPTYTSPYVTSKGLPPIEYFKTLISNVHYNFISLVGFVEDFLDNVGDLISDNQIEGEDDMVWIIWHLVSIVFSVARLYFDEKLNLIGEAMGEDISLANLRKLCQIFTWEKIFRVKDITVLENYLKENEIIYNNIYDEYSREIIKRALKDKNIFNACTNLTKNIYILLVASQLVFPKLVVCIDTIGKETECYDLAHSKEVERLEPRQTCRILMPAIITSETNEVFQKALVAK